jgi:hypothetical protein
MYWHRAHGLCGLTLIPLDDVSDHTPSRTRVSTDGTGMTSQPSNLPAARSPLIGRKADLLAICDLILDGDARLLTRVGAGGLRKMSLGVAPLRRTPENGAYLPRWSPSEWRALSSSRRMFTTAFKADLKVRACLKK